MGKRTYSLPRGVTPSRSRINPYRAMHRGCYLGVFKTAEEAGAARDDARKEYESTLPPKREPRKKAKDRPLRSPDWPRGRDGAYDYVCDRLSKIRSYSEKIGREFSLTPEIVLGVLSSQQGRCALSGVEMSFPGDGGPKSISVDRIDSSRGYTPDNIHLVCRAVNTMKLDMEMGDFVDWCESVARTRGNCTITGNSLSSE